LGVPAVNIGTRQTGRERGRNVIDTVYDRHQIKEAIAYHLNNDKAPMEAIYGDGRAGKRIADLLATVPLTIEKKLTY
jgi:UDP-N-acetylglucosamine 2-epimerase